MTFGSRAKGSKAELEIAKMFAAWWEPVEPGSIFKRTPGSGGWGDPDARGKFRTAGDIVTSAKRFPFCIEVKRREGWSIDNLIDGKKSPVWGYWRQAVKASDEMKGIPLLIFRKNREPWLAMVPFVELYARRLRTLASWDSEALKRREVDYANVLPFLMTLEQLLFTDPKEWAVAAPLAEG